MFNLLDALKFLPAVGPVVAALPEFKNIWDSIVNTFKGEDQETLKEAYADLIADNDEGHRRLQQKLQAAAQQ